MDIDRALACWTVTLGGFSGRRPAAAAVCVRLPARARQDARPSFPTGSEGEHVCKMAAAHQAV